MTLPLLLVPSWALTIDPVGLCCAVPLKLAVLFLHELLCACHAVEAAERHTILNGNAQKAICNKELAIGNIHSSATNSVFNNTHDKHNHHNTNTNINDLNN